MFRMWFRKHRLLSSPAQRHLYIADDNEIRSLDPSVSNWRYEQIFQGDANVRIDAMDLHVKTNRIYWTNWHTRRISSYDLPSSSTSSQNSNRNRRQSDTRVTNLDVSLYSPDMTAKVDEWKNTSPLFSNISLDSWSEDASGHCCGLGGRKPVLDWLWQRCDRGCSDERWTPSQNPDLRHDWWTSFHCSGSPERVSEKHPEFGGIWKRSTSDGNKIKGKAYRNEGFATSSGKCTGRIGVTTPRLKQPLWMGPWGRPSLKKTYSGQQVKHTPYNNQL